jgi:hypothetical protein
MSDNYFTVLNSIDVSGHVEKKNGFSYLSWPFAIAELRKRHPTATWCVNKFEWESRTVPFMVLPDQTYMVEVCVTVEGVSLAQVHPVLDYRNKAIKNPSAWDINTSIQRALVKAIALHGLGLFVYAGEDLPISDEGVGKKGNGPLIPSRPKSEDLGLSDEELASIREMSVYVEDVVKDDPKAALAFIQAQGLESEQKIALFNLLDSKTRSALTKAKE